MLHFCLDKCASLVKIPLHVEFSCARMQIADIWSCGVMVYVMLVGAYPFERPEDKHDNQKLQKMIQVRRVLLPASSCLDVLSTKCPERRG